MGVRLQDGSEDGTSTSHGCHIDIRLSNSRQYAVSVPQISDSRNRPCCGIFRRGLCPTSLPVATIQVSSTVRAKPSEEALPKRYSVSASHPASRKRFVGNVQWPKFSTFVRAVGCCLNTRRQPAAVACIADIHYKLIVGDQRPTDHSP